MTAEVPPGGWDRPVPAQPVSDAPLAGWWSRVAAAMIDLTVIAVPATLIGTLIFGGVTAAFSVDGGAGIFAAILGAIAYVLLLVAAAIVYAPILMKRDGEHNGQTWGKQALGIRVVRTDGTPMDFTWSALREAGVKGLGLGFASAVIPLLPYLLDALWPLWDDENRALHDLLMGTRVVRA